MSDLGLTAAQIKDRLEKATASAHMDGFNGPDGRTKDDVIEDLTNLVDELRADVEQRENRAFGQKAIDALGAVGDILGLTREEPPYTIAQMLDVLRDLKAQHDKLYNERADALSWTDVPYENYDEESLPQAVERLKLKADEAEALRAHTKVVRDEERRATVEEVRKNLDWHLDDLLTVKHWNGTGAVVRSLRTRMSAFLKNLAEHRPPKPTFPGGQIRTESGKVVESG